MATKNTALNIITQNIILYKGNQKWSPHRSDNWCEKDNFDLGLLKFACESIFLFYSPSLDGWHKEFSHESIGGSRKGDF